MVNIYLYKGRQRILGILIQKMYEGPYIELVLLFVVF